MQPEEALVGHASGPGPARPEEALLGQHVGCHDPCSLQRPCGGWYSVLSGPSLPEEVSAGLGLRPVTCMARRGLSGGWGG